jgi:predicted short-subunit dehydrogenase-like oxidoreductase (DUF2520 family)
MARILIIGAGRAGSSLARALRSVGSEVEGPHGRSFDLEDIDAEVEIVVLATSDDAIPALAARLRPSANRVVVHLSGSLGLDVLVAHPRSASLHPLVPLPNAQLGAARLLSGASFAVAGDERIRELVELLGGKVVEVADEDRVRYHAAACVAANHVVALMGQVERLAASAGLGLEDFMALTRAALDDVERLGPAHALTGPASRGDWLTLERHLEAIDPAERAAYRAGVGLALELVASPGVGQLAGEPSLEDPGSRRPSDASLVS